jgi:mRNA interferase HicA
MLAIRTKMSDNIRMKGNEFLRLMRKLAKKNGWSYEWRPDMGKGSHGVLMLNGKRTVVRNLADELKTGTYHAMLSQLELKPDDLR